MNQEESEQNEVDGMKKEAVVWPRLCLFALNTQIKYLDLIFF